jgi:RNA polymerase sigma-B factor
MLIASMGPCIDGPSSRVLTTGPTNVDIVLAYRAAKEAGDTREAQRQRTLLLLKNQGLVRKLVGRFARPQSEADSEDAMQAGSMGLLRALEDFDPGRSSFSTYAAHWVRDHIQRWAGKNTAVTRPRSASMPASVAKAAALHRLKTGKEPTAEDLGVTPAALAEWSEGSHFVYIDEDATEEHGRQELTSDVKEAEHAIDRMAVERFWEEAVNALSERNREIAEAYFWSGEKQQDIADRFGISQSFVVKICQRVEERLKRAVARSNAPPSSRKPIEHARAWAVKMKTRREGKPS